MIERLRAYRSWRELARNEAATRIINKTIEQYERIRETEGQEAADAFAEKEDRHIQSVYRWADR